MGIGIWDSYIRKGGVILRYQKNGPGYLSTLIVKM
jgi:hypothetical protein